MELGVVFPQTEIGADPAAIRDYAEGVDEMGLSHMLVYDEVLGTDPSGHEGWSGTFDYEDMFHEPLVLYGYLAGITRKIRLVTSILVITARQTALVAKQAAEVDVLSDGRFTLGLGLGWSRVAYRGLGEDFQNRGRRCEEQIEVLRALWTKESVDFTGEWHRIEHAGINPLPVQRPIPIWLGGGAEPVVRRIGRLADGWLVSEVAPDAEFASTLERMRGYAEEAGRDPASIGLNAEIEVSSTPSEQWAAEAEKWDSLEATHLSVQTMGAGLRSVDEHLNVVRRFQEIVGSV